MTFFSCDKLACDNLNRCNSVSYTLDALWSAVSVCNVTFPIDCGYQLPVLWSCIYASVVWQPPNSYLGVMLCYTDNANNRDI